MLSFSEEKSREKLKKRQNDEKRLLWGQRSHKIATILSKIELDNDFFTDNKIQQEWDLLIRDQRYKEGTTKLKRDLFLLSQSFFYFKQGPELIMWGNYFQAESLKQMNSKTT